MKAEPTVLHVMEAFAGGTERHLLDLIRHVEGFEHVIAIPSIHHGRSTARAAALAEDAGARVVRIEMSRARTAHHNASATIVLRRLVDRLSPEIVHGHSSIGGAVARLACIGRNVPVVYTPHGFSRSRWAIAVERLLCRRTDRLIAVSVSEREFALANRLAPVERVIVIPNGIELTPPFPLAPPLRERLGVPTDAPFVGCVGRLAWQKAPEVYVRACAQVGASIPAARFVLIGSGPLREPVDRAITAAGLSGRFHLVPSLEDAAGTFGELTVYVLPSRFEGGPYTPLEAMRAGTPVVVTNVAGNRDVVEHQVTGLIVNPDDPDALAGAITSLIKDPALCKRLVSEARAALPGFDVRKMARATAGLYMDLLRDPAPRPQVSPS